MERHYSVAVGHRFWLMNRFLVLIAEFDRREGWHVAGARSCAQWLNWKVGLDLDAARERVRAGLPL